MPDTKILVASHNIERGEGVPNLHTLSGKYDRILAALPRPIDVLCLQEQQRFNGINLAPTLRRAIGENAGIFFDRRQRRLVKRNLAACTVPHVFPDPAILWNADRLHSVRRMLYPIQKLEEYDLMGKIFGTDNAQQRFAVNTRLRLKNGAPFDVTSFHLDAWGGNGFKQQQLQSVVDGLDAHIGNDHDGNPVTTRGIFCGDTNIYTPFWIPSKKLQRSEFHRILAETGLHDPADDITFHYTRVRGESRSARTIRAARRVHLLRDSRFDTVAVRDLPILYHGVIETPWSDHDFVWAIVDVG